MVKKSLSRYNGLNNNYKDNKMIYGVRLGSLGNQMHIVAATYATAIDMQTDWAISNKTNEGYHGGIKRSSFNDTFFRSAIKKGPPTGHKSFSEGAFKYRHITKHKNLILKGYFQSDKYYGHRKNEIIDLFYEFYPEVQDKVQGWFNHMDQNKTISLHIRRTDYVKLAKVHHVQPMEYYESGINAIAEKQNISPEQLKQDYHFLVFSDDLEWCKNQDFFKSLHCTFVDNQESPDLNAIIDLYTMAQCKHNIIANSSFSWWSAYLNKHEDKIVVAPKQWFGPRGPKYWEDIYTENMIIL